MGTIGRIGRRSQGRKHCVQDSESAINYIPDDPDIEIELAFLDEGKTL